MRHSEAQSQKRFEYVRQLFAFHDSLIDEALKKAESFQKPHMTLSPYEGAFLSFLVSSFQLNSVIEIGTFTGHSALWIAAGLKPKGRLICIEKDPQYAQFCRDLFHRYNHHPDREKDHKRVDLLEGDALDLLRTLKTESPVDGVFIDAQKSAYGRYLDWIEENMKQNGWIFADNVYLRDSVWDSQASHPWSSQVISQMQSFNQRLAHPHRYRSFLVDSSDGLFVAQKLF